MAIIVLQPGDVLRLRVCCYDTASMQLGMNVLYYRITSIVGGLTYLEDAADAFQAFVSKPQVSGRSTGTDRAGWLGAGTTSPSRRRTTTSQVSMCLRMAT
jgi:hypothetical protein